MYLLFEGGLHLLCHYSIVNIVQQKLLKSKAYSPGFYEVCDKVSTNAKCLRILPCFYSNRIIIETQDLPEDRLSMNQMLFLG